MKRIWFAAVFLAVAVSLCTAEQVYIRRFVGEMNDRTAVALTCVQKDDEPGVRKAIAAIRRYWDDNNDIVLMLTRHNELDTLGEHIRTLGSPHNDITVTLEEIRALTFVFYENQRITPANIL